MIYAHFSELMPFAHRGVFRVEQTGDGFRLSYPTEDAERFEALDVIASELALTALDNDFRVDAACYLRMIDTWPRERRKGLHHEPPRGLRFPLERCSREHFRRRDSL